jgi:hypothetical protein
LKVSFKRPQSSLSTNVTISCAQSGGPDFALSWAIDKGLGIADPQCDEWNGNDKPYFPCGDRSGRAVRLPHYTALKSVSDQKTWLANVGPITACFNIYNDWGTFNFASGKPYKWNGMGAAVNSHCFLIVGYDDNIGGWLFRNSWGSSWGMSGYGYIA